MGPLCLARHTWWCCCISVVPEATHEASRGPEKGAMSAQKGLQGSETETRELLGGTEENSVSPMIMIFHKKETEKNEFVARTGISMTSINLKPLPGPPNTIGPSHRAFGLESFRHCTDPLSLSDAKHSQTFHHQVNGQTIISNVLRAFRVKSGSRTVCRVTL